MTEADARKTLPTGLDRTHHMQSPTPASEKVLSRHANTFVSFSMAFAQFSQIFGKLSIGGLPILWLMCPRPAKKYTPDRACYPIATHR
jgi:hypothetical protein